jgi:hypothetical protein
MEQSFGLFGVCLCPLSEAETGIERNIHTVVFSVQYYDERATRFWTPKTGIVKSSAFTSSVPGNAPGNAPGQTETVCFGL